jgi:hypothetical protein
MTDRTVEPSPRLRARLAGASYLITIVTGVFAEVFVRGALVVRDDAAATAANILAHERMRGATSSPGCFSGFTAS